MIKKISIIICYTFFNTFVQAQKKDNKTFWNRILEQGDQYFETNNANLAYRYYDSIFHHSNFYTPRMLLRLANIERRENSNIPTSLYYLNICYEKTRNKKIFKQIQTIAEKNDLIGYTYTDLDFFLNLYDKYKYYLVSFFGLLASMILILKRQKISKTFVIINLFLVIGLICFLNNYNYKRLYGITMNEQINLYDIPSPAGHRVYKLDKGHRLRIIGQEDIWYKVLWNKQKVFINKNEIREIKLTNESEL